MATAKRYHRKVNIEAVKGTPYLHWIWVFLMSTRVNIRANWEVGGKSPQESAPSLLTPVASSGDSQKHYPIWCNARGTHITYWKLLRSGLWFIIGKGCRFLKAREDAHRVESGKGTKCGASVAHSAWSQDILFPSSDVWQCSQSIFDQEMYPSLCVQHFYRGSIT